MIRILLVDDHAMVREGLAAVLADEPEFRVIGEAATARSRALSSDSARSAPRLATSPTPQATACRNDTTSSLVSRIRTRSAPTRRRPRRIATDSWPSGSST